MVLKGMQIIASEFRTSGTRCFAAVNPATGDLLAPRFKEASADDIDSAVKAAADSFDPYRMLPTLQRARDSAQAITCMNNLRQTYHCWGNYGEDFHGWWYAPWPAPRFIGGVTIWYTQWPYMMKFWVSTEHANRIFEYGKDVG